MDFKIVTILVALGLGFLASIFVANSYGGSFGGVRGTARGTIYVLGDSLSDVGTNSEGEPTGTVGLVLEQLGANSFVDQYPYQDGSYSDAGTWVRQLKKTKCFAYGGAMLSFDRPDDAPCADEQVCSYEVPGADAQFAMFQQEFASTFNLKKDVLVFQFGANDLFLLGRQVGEFLTTNATSGDVTQEDVDQAISSFAATLGQKYTSVVNSAKGTLGESAKIVLFNIPGSKVPAPLGALLDPRVVASLNSAADLVNTWINENQQSVGYTAFELDEAIVTAKNELSAANAELIMDSGCAALGCYPWYCPSELPSCAPETLKNHFWVDVLHPSTAVHEIIAREFETLYRSMIA